MRPWAAVIRVLALLPLAIVATAPLAFAPARAAAADDQGERSGQSDRTRQSGQTGGRIVDAAIASVRGALVALSDVALARALGLFELAPGSGPIPPADIARYIDALLALREAEQLAVRVPPEDSARAWEAAGGAVLAARLEAVGIDPGLARRLIDDDIRVRRFIDLRFQSFAFVTDTEVGEALGPGTHDEAARQATRDRLRVERAARAREEWAVEARSRARIRTLVAPEGGWPAPFSLPPASGR